MSAKPPGPFAIRWRPAPEAGGGEPWYGRSDYDGCDERESVGDVLRLVVGEQALEPGALLFVLWDGQTRVDPDRLGELFFVTDERELRRARTRSLGDDVGWFRRWEGRGAQANSIIGATTRCQLGVRAQALAAVACIDTELRRYARGGMDATTARSALAPVRGWALGTPSVGADLLERALRSARRDGCSLASGVPVLVEAVVDAALAEDRGEALRVEYRSIERLALAVELAAAGRPRGNARGRPSRDRARSLSRMAPLARRELPLGRVLLGDYRYRVAEWTAGRLGGPRP